MEPVILVIHLFLALGIIALVLLQRSEGGGLGIGGGGLGGFSTARGTANALTKTTAIFAAAFFVTSLTLGVLAGTHSTKNTGILADVDANAVTAPIDPNAQHNALTTETPPSAPLDIEVVPEENQTTNTTGSPQETPAVTTTEPAAPVSE